VKSRFHVLMEGMREKSTWDIQLVGRLNRITLHV
jgi:hypothetical protein